MLRCWSHHLLCHKLRHDITIGWNDQQGGLLQTDSCYTYVTAVLRTDNRYQAQWKGWWTKTQAKNKQQSTIIDQPLPFSPNIFWSSSSPLRHRSSWSPTTASSAPSFRCIIKYTPVMCKSPTASALMSDTIPSCQLWSLGVVPMQTQTAPLCVVEDVMLIPGSIRSVKGQSWRPSELGYLRLEAQASSLKAFRIFLPPSPPPVVPKDSPP
jgi:hypothetical protein